LYDKQQESETRRPLADAIVQVGTNVPLMQETRAAVHGAVNTVEGPDGTKQTLEIVAVGCVVSKKVESEGLDMMNGSTAKLSGEIGLLGAGRLGVERQDSQSPDMQDAIRDDARLKEGANGRGE
jgi:hypothetical protein